MLARFTIDPPRERSMRRPTVWTWTCVMLTLAVPAGAQTDTADVASPARASTVETAEAAPGPAALRLAPAPQAVRTALSDGARRTLLGNVRPPAVALPQARDRGGIPYMAAGGALFVAGAIAGDTAGALMMVGGGVIGSYGIFRYFGGDVE